MFGHHDKPKPQDDQDQNSVTDKDQAESNAADDQAEQTATVDAPADDNQASGVPNDDIKDSSPDTAESEPATDGDDWQHPGTPLEDNKTIEADEERIRDVISPAGGYPKQPSYQYSSSSDLGLQTEDKNANGELIDIRKHALDDLAPIIDKLGLPPEDKFRVLMMIIQTNDDQDLVKKAYETAHSIEDEKARGQALLDIVNEINYFTQPASQEQK